MRAGGGAPGRRTLLAEERREGDARHLDDLEANAGDIAHGVTLAAEARNKHLVLQGGETAYKQGRQAAQIQQAALSSGKVTAIWLPSVRARTFSSMKFKQPSLGTKQAIFLPFLISWTRTHLRMAELGCLASMPLWMVTGARVSTRRAQRIETEQPRRAAQTRRPGRRRGKP